MENLIKDVSELVKAIDAWGKQGKAWTKNGHKLALSALARLAEHGDIGPVNRLYLAMPKGTKSSAMAEWILAFGKVVPNTGDDSKEKPFVYSKEKTTDMAAAVKKPWYEFKPEPSVVECFDVQAKVRAFLKQLESGAAKAQTATGMELIDQIKSLLSGEEEADAGLEADPLSLSS